MENTKSLIERVYSAFNRRDIDGALALMSEDVDWPKASEGGRVVGKEAIREYWTRQGSEFDPHVEPVEVKENPAGMVEVKVHQVVKDLKGAVISDQMVMHVFQLSEGLIQRMDVQESKSAFAREPA
jgi:ketosteroid isomerase-like protein